MVLDFFEVLSKGDHVSFREWLLANPGVADLPMAGGATPAQVAMYHGRKPWADMLAGQMSEVDLGTACTMGDIHRVEAILAESPASINELSGDGFLPICLAAAFGHEQLVELLLRHGASLELQSTSLGGVRPLDSAIFGQNQSIIHRILVAGAHPNLPQSGGFYPIHGAAQNGNIEVIQDLISHGADPFAKTDEGLTALQIGKAHPHVVAFFESLKA